MKKVIIGVVADHAASVTFAFRASTQAQRL